MERHPIITKDGSHTISVPQLNVTYHSIHGAIQESLHVFIEAGFKETVKKMPGDETLYIFEMGFGTGLNAFLTSIEAVNCARKVYYYAVEKYPLSTDEVNQLNYPQECKHLHTTPWDADSVINDYFTLHKSRIDLLNLSTLKHFNLIYYDAFAPNAQPELWTQPVFEKLYSMMSPGGILVTYCSKGDVRRAMKAAGFIIEKILGPPGKREMLRGRR
jgi:tRNA U34 5-methylaminomethyl-2-thiouridine-forming methyltransferase MnmC